MYIHIIQILFYICRYSVYSYDINFVSVCTLYIHTKYYIRHMARRNLSKVSYVCTYAWQRQTNLFLVFKIVWNGGMEWVVVAEFRFC